MNTEVFVYSEPSPVEGLSYIGLLIRIIILQLLI